MPRSKRAPTKRNRKGFTLKQKVVEEVHSFAEKYDRCFTFSVNNMRNIHLKELRDKWRTDSRFLFGKKKVIMLGLGKGPEDEHLDGLHQVGQHLGNEASLFFTNRKKAEVLNFFNNYVVADYSRSGDMAIETVVLEAGPLKIEHCHSMEPQLRQWGLPTSLVRGVITLTQDHQVCKKGEKLTPEKCRILKLLGYQMTNLTIKVTGMWTKESGKWESLGIAKKEESLSMDTGDNDEEDDEEEDDDEEDEEKDIADT